MASVSERPLFLGVPPPVPQIADPKPSQLLVIGNLPWVSGLRGTKALCWALSTAPQSLVVVFTLRFAASSPLLRLQFKPVGLR